MNPYEDAAGSDSTATFFSGLDVNPLGVNYLKSFAHSYKMLRL